MTMIGEVWMRDVIVCTPEVTVAAAAKLMRHHHVGSLVIVDRGNGGLGIPLGIVTDRDIVVEVTATDLDPNTMMVLVYRASSSQADRLSRDVLAREAA